MASFAGSLVNFRGPLLAAMQCRGHCVHACAPGLLAEKNVRQWLEARGVTCHNVELRRTGINPFHDLVAFAKLVGLMRRVKPNVFLGYTIKPVIWGLLAARVTSVSQRVALVTGLGYAFTGANSGKRALIQRIVRRLYAWALAEAHLIFMQNPDDRNEFARIGLLPKGVVVEIVNGSGVDLGRFPLRPLPEGPPKFLLIARILGDKGIREYAAAAASLKRVWPDAEFHLVGGLDTNPDGISEKEVANWVRNGILIWHGTAEDVRPALANCHVYVLPSYREGTPRTVLEAMATGRPIITTDAPGCRETVINGENGFLIPPRDSRALAGAMERFLEDPSQIPTMGQRSYEIARQKYDVSKVNAAMLKAMGL